MNVSDYMSTHIVYLREGDHAAIARRPMLDFGVNAIPVLDDELRPGGRRPPARSRRREEAGVACRARCVHDRSDGDDRRGGAQAWRTTTSTTSSSSTSTASPSACSPRSMSCAGSSARRPATPRRSGSSSRRRATATSSRNTGASDANARRVGRGCARSPSLRQHAPKRPQQHEPSPKRELPNYDGRGYREPGRPRPLAAARRPLAALLHRGVPAPTAARLAHDPGREAPRPRAPLQLLRVRPRSQDRLRARRLRRVRLQPERRHLGLLGRRVLDRTTTSASTTRSGPTTGTRARSPIAGTSRSSNSLQLRVAGVHAPRSGLLRPRARVGAVPPEPLPRGALRRELASAVVRVALVAHRRRRAACARSISRPVTTGAIRASRPKRAPARSPFPYGFDRGYIEPYGACAPLDSRPRRHDGLRRAPRGGGRERRGRRALASSGWVR